MWTQTHPNDAKQPLYQVMLVCRLWYQLGVQHLWNSIHLESYPISHRRYQYCNRLFDTLDKVPEAWLHLQHVRTLNLEFHNNELPISSIEQCEAILHRMGRLRYIFHYATEIRCLTVYMDPFIPTDCDDSELWPLLERANIIMQDMAMAIRERRGMQKVDIRLGREIYRYEPRGRIETESLLRILDSSISHLNVSDSSLHAVNEWLSRIGSLTELRLSLYKNENEERQIAIANFWQNIDRLHLQVLCLQISFTIPRMYGNLLYLREIAVSEIESALDAAQLFYTHLPQLQVCAINRSQDRFMEIKNIRRFEGTVTSKSMRTITFGDSVAPRGLIEQIAQTSTANIDIVNLPRNATNSDLKAITTFGRNLRVLNLEASPQITCLLPVMDSRRLEALRIGWN
jgi:hypothetical protein